MRPWTKGAFSRGVHGCEYSENGETIEVQRASAASAFRLKRDGCCARRYTLKPLGVPAQVIFDEGRDEIIGMVVTILHPQRQFLPRILRGGGEEFGA